MMYYNQGIYSNMRFYKEMINDGDLLVLDFGTMPPVEVHVAITQSRHHLGFLMPLIHKFLTARWSVLTGKI